MSFHEKAGECQVGRSSFWSVRRRFGKSGCKNRTSHSSELLSEIPESSDMSSLPVLTYETTKRLSAMKQKSTVIAAWQEQRGLNLMTQLNVRSIVSVLSLSLMGLVFLMPAVAAETVKLEGLIKSRTGDTMTVQSSGSPDVTVLLSNSTEVGQVQGVFKARRKEMSMAALIPGLKVNVEGTYNDQNQFVDKSVSFKGNDLKDAEKIEAGMHETKAQLQQQSEALQQQQAQLAEHQAKIAANKAAIDAAVARFGQLDDYYIFY